MNTYFRTPADEKANRSGKADDNHGILSLQPSFKLTCLTIEQKLKSY